MRGKFRRGASALAVRCASTVRDRWQPLRPETTFQSSRDTRDTRDIAHPDSGQEADRCKPTALLSRLA
jgi:hypothetical protein